MKPQKYWRGFRRDAALMMGFAFAVAPLSVGCSDNRAEAAKAKAQAERYLERKDFTAAVAPLRQLARLRPESPDVYPDLAQSVKRSRERPALLQEAEANLAKNPNDVEALTIAANALTDGDDAHKKMEYERRLVKLRPHDTLFKFTLAQELVNSFQYAEARPLLEELVTAMPDEAAPLFLRGQTYYFEKPDADGLAEAASDFQKAQERDPNLHQTHLFLGRVYLRQGKTQEAIGELNQAAQSMPHNPDVAFELANAFRAAGDADKAKKSQAEFVRLREQAARAETMAIRCTAYPQDFGLQLETARLMLKKGDLNRSAFYLKHALTLRPDDPAARAFAQELQELRNTGGGQ